eukprot:m.179078 g.179078  ORF g.179078 m.179078 type:complete len:413 (+) comp21432_c0_seq1:192-1430(+)
MPPRSSKRKAASADDDGDEGAGTAVHKWTQVHNKKGGDKLPLLLVGDSPEAKPNTKILAFDIDWTIIKTKSGKTFPTGPSDWVFWHDSVPKVLKSMHEKDYKIVFFTNQGGIEKGKSTPAEMQKKFSAIVQQLGLPIQVLANTGNTHFRKPCICLWDYFENNLNGGVKVDRSKSMFVGDAAGRPKGWKSGAKKDFSASDRMFAANIGMPFQTPEEFFLGEKVAASFEWGALDARAFLEKVKDRKLPALHSDSQEVVVLVGRPASGKSAIRKHHFEKHGYVVVNRDTLGTQAKCEKVAEEALKDGKSVLIDNTNPEKAKRAIWVKMAKKHGVPARCFYMDTDQELASHLNYHRQNMTEGESRRVPMVAYRSYDKNFEAPSKDEGFVDVRTLSFVPHFESDEERERFCHWNCAD